MVIKAMNKTAIKGRPKVTPKICLLPIVKKETQMVNFFPVKNFALVVKFFTQCYDVQVKTELLAAGTYAQSKSPKGQSFGQKNLGSKVSGLNSPQNPDYKLDLSQTSKLAESGSSSTSSASLKDIPLPSLPSVPSAPSTPDLPKPELKTDEKIKDLAKEEAPKKIEEVTKTEIKKGSLKNPAIFFIKGLDMFSSPSKSEGGYAGVGRIADTIEGSRIYGWNQKEEMIEEIQKIHKDYPVVLVGHSLGGDTAVEIAEELDSLKENFRKVDLLVTIDAIGFSHDIIPQNVKKHLNIFGENSFFLKDGPHVARREEKTEVRNILSPLDHTDIDDDKEVQFEVVEAINNTLGDFKLKRPS
jgi:hypothetical protein